MHSTKAPFVLEELSSINVDRMLEQSELVGLTEQAQPNEDSVPTVHDLTVDHD